MFIPAETTEAVVYEFGPFQLNPRETVLLNKNGGVIQLTPKVFDTLLALVEQAGHVVAKDDLIQQLWPDTVVEEGSLTQNISLLRRALADGNGGKKYIDTIPKRGYRFVVPVRVVAPDGTRDHKGAFDQHSQAIVAESSSMQVVVEEEESVADAVETRAAVVETNLRKINHARLIYLMVGICVLVAASLSFYSWYRRDAREIVTVRSIAVLPFKTIGSQNREDLLGLGMADSLIIRLSHLEQTRIMPTGSVMKYTNQDQNPILIGRDLGVEAVLDGTVQRDGDRIRVTAQLIRLHDGKALWSGKFDEKYQDIFHLQDLVSEQVADSLLPEMSRERRPVSGALTENVEAYQDYLTGIYFWNIRTKANLPKAISYLEQAVQKDPKFARAYAVLADSYFLASQPEYELLPEDESLRRAEQSAQRALELNQNIPEAHVVKARVLDARSNFNEAEREFRRALEIDSNSAVTHLRYGCFLLYSRVNLSAAMVQVDRARQLDPVSPLVNYKYAFMLYLSRDYDLAISFYKRALELQTDVPNAHMHLSAVYVQKGMFEEALDEIQKASQDNPRRVLSSKAILFGFWGRRSEALKVLAELNRLAGKTDALSVAAVYGALGDKRTAIEWLKKVHIDQSTSALLQFDPQMDPLRKDPAFPDVRLALAAD